MLDATTLGTAVVAGIPVGQRQRAHGDGHGGGDYRPLVAGDSGRLHSSCLPNADLPPWAKGPVVGGAGPVSAWRAPPDMTDRVFGEAGRDVVSTLGVTLRPFQRSLERS